jgi:hypothetical protein
MPRRTISLSSTTSTRRMGDCNLSSHYFFSTTQTALTMDGRKSSNQKYHIRLAHESTGFTVFVRVVQMRKTTPSASVINITHLCDSTCEVHCAKLTFDTNGEIIILSSAEQRCPQS